MIAVVNRLPVKEGLADQVVERFANGRGFVQDFPGFVSMEVLRSEGADEVMVITRWQDKDAFDSWVRSEESRTPSALAVPRLTVTAVMLKGPTTIHRLVSEGPGSGVPSAERLLAITRGFEHG